LSNKVNKMAHNLVALPHPFTYTFSEAVEGKVD
jgi:hypothetical protein